MRTVILSAIFSVMAAQATSDPKADLVESAAVLWAETLGRADACSMQRRRDQVAPKAELVADSVKPGLSNWFSGAQADYEDRLTRHMTAAYNASRRESCSALERQLQLPNLGYAETALNQALDLY